MGQGETLNLGQISAIWISPNAPENLQLIWYDITERVHKVFDTSSREWTALNPQVVTNSTIDTLRNIAINSGLSIGKFFFLTDVGTLAIAITTTKIWYVDSQNNYVVNDLATSIVSYINSNNLLIDGSTGVWDNETGRLKFDFTTVSSGDNLQNNNDYIVLRRYNGSVWSWIKTKISNFISTVAGNSITWNNGLYFNFSAAINAIKNYAGGIVGYDAYVENNESINLSIQNVAQTSQQILNQANSYTDQETAAAKIYGKKHADEWNVLDNPPDVPNQTATLNDILQILVSWANVLQDSNRIKVGSGFSSTGRSGNINYSDTVRTALEKLVYGLNSLSGWRNERFINRLTDWITTNGLYKTWQDSDATREEIKTCSYRVFENTLALKCASYTQMRTFIGNEGYNILTDVNEDDITLTFKELPAAIIDALIGKYGKNNPFLVGIPVFGRVSTSYGTFSTETANPILIARGNMFGIIVSTTIDSVEYNYLKLIPYCTECEVYQSVLVSMPPDRSDYIRQIYKKGMNTNGKYGTDWILDSMGIPTDSAVDNAYRPNWLAVISPFCIEIPLY